MELLAVTVPPDTLRHLPTHARPVVDPADTWVPEGYAVEAVVAGLSFPCGMGFNEDGSLFLLEGGSTWPTRPTMLPRILRLDPNGRLTTFAMETQGGPRGAACRDGFLYVSVKGGYYAHIARYDLKTGERQVIVDKIPSGGWHEPGGPVFGPHDGLIYFAHGSVSQAGVVLPQGFTVDLAKQPLAHDIPGEDVTLTGNNVWSRDPLMPYPYLVETGPYKPFGVPARKGEVIIGELWCTTGLWRANPDGTEPELLAWGLRNPYGMAFNEAGQLYVADNCQEEKGERAVAEDPDRIWQIRNAERPRGSIMRPEWYGFPEICATGKPVWDEQHRPTKGVAAEPLIENPPPWAGPPVYLEKPHSCMTQMDFCRSDAFGRRGKLFACEWGTLAPLNSPREADLENGFRVMCVDVEHGTAEVFFRNREPDPETYRRGGGIQRPVDCKFHPDGRSLYVLDFGSVRVTKGYMQAFAHTGVLWRITRR